MLPRACPACEGSRDLAPVEEWRDPVAGAAYRLYRCGSCGLVFSDPRDPVGPEWYEKSAPLRAAEARPAPGSDWRFRKFFAAELPAGKVLDVGCGDGGFLSLARERGWSGVGVDYDARMIAAAAAKGLDARAQDYGTFLKGRSAKEFDAAVLFDVLEHAPEPRELLALIKPVLKRGGTLLVTFPNEARPALFGRREEYDYPPHHFTRWNPRALRSFLEREGFTVVELATPGPTVRWFSEVLFFGLLAPAAIAAARRVLFGPEASGRLSDLYAAGASTPSEAPPDGVKGFLSDRARRQKAVNAFKYACRLVTYPAGLLLSLAYGLRGDSGEYLYARARYDGENV